MMIRFTLHALAYGAALLAGALALAFITGPARACDLALVLLQDTSTSLDDAELVQMREGVANALTDPRLSSAFGAASVQIAVVSYAGNSELVVDWFHAEPDSLAAAAERIRSMRRVTVGMTATGDAIAYALAQLERVDCAANVIDVATDGENNEGRSPMAVTAELDPFAVQVNGLVIGEAHTVRQFESTTQFGAGAFTMHVGTYDDFGRAMLRKISLEVAMNVGGRHAL